jgi:hypothetical protein
VISVETGDKQVGAFGVAWGVLAEVLQNAVQVSGRVFFDEVIGDPERVEKYVEPRLGNVRQSRNDIEDSQFYKFCRVLSWA